jgi:predicted HicB family RNase H-like nuclease
MRRGKYLARIEYDPDLDCFFGQIVNLTSPVTFYGKTTAELRRQFGASLDTYLAVCGERGIEPEKPYSGRFNVRIAPATHRKASLAAALRGTSLNELVETAIRKEAEEALTGR